MELARCLCTGLPVREKPRRFHLILPIPVLVHLTGSVLDEGAPRCNNVLHASYYSCREGLAWQLQQSCSLGLARASLSTFLCEGVFCACLLCVFFAAWPVCFVFLLGDYYISRVRADPAFGAIRSRTRTTSWWQPPASCRRQEGQVREQEAPHNTKHLPLFSRGGPLGASWSQPSGLGLGSGVRVS